MLRNGGGSGGSGGATSYGQLTDATTVDLGAVNTPLAAELGAKATIGKIGRASDVTSSRAFAASDFGVGIVPLNSASVLAMTLPTVASMSLSGSGNVLPIQVMGAGIPTFAGATSSTSINGVAGTTTVAPLGGAPVQYGIYVLTQIGSTDAWSLN